MALQTKYVVLLVTIIGLLQCTATQLSATAFTSNDSELAKHLFFLAYCSMYTNVIFLPIHHFFESKRKLSSIQQRDQDGEVENINNSEGPQSPMKLMSTAKLASVVCFLYVCYVGANVCFTTSLSSGMLPSITASIFAVCPVFVVFLSWVMIKIQPHIIHWGALLCGVVGVIVALQPWNTSSIFSSDNHNNQQQQPENRKNITALICAICSPLFAATYKVTFAKFFTNSKWYEAGRILGLLTIPNVIIGSTLITIVLATGAESNPFSDSASSSTEAAASMNTSLCQQQLFLQSTNITTAMSFNSCDSNNQNQQHSSLGHVPGSLWTIYICANIVSIFFNLAVNWGVTLVPPLYVSIGTILSTLCNTFVDAALGRGWPPAVAWVGMVLIVISFICVAVAANTDEAKSKRAESLLMMRHVEEEEEKENIDGEERLVSKNRLYDSS